MQNEAVSTSYTTLLGAAKGLLIESASLVAKTGLRYCVVGGWSPLIFNSSPIQHPGTRDVDLLFAEGDVPGRLGEVVQIFLANGFHPSAKHEFQVLRALNVLGKEFVFNLDLLHPTDSSPATSAMFSKHLSLPAPRSEFRSDDYIVMSIVLPFARFLFDKPYIETVAVSTEAPNGLSAPVDVKLMTEIGTVVTKAASVNRQKRDRDGFDIYLAVAQARSYRNLLDDAKRLRRTNAAAFNVISELRIFRDSKEKCEHAAELLNENGGKGISYGIVAQKIEQFLKDIDFPEKVKSDYTTSSE